MKFYKHILVSFVTAILTIFVVYGGYSIYAEVTAVDFNEFYAFTRMDADVTFTELKSKYHSSINNYFNHKFETMAKLIDDNEKFWEKDEFKPPKSDEKIIETCKTNVSTYCTAMGAMDIYLKYLIELNNMKGKVPKIETTTPSVKLIVDLVETRGSEVDKDAKDAKTVIDATLNVYKEFQSAYPMHKKYRQIIDTLTKYKIALGKIREQTDKFPLRFVDATSDQCE